MASTFGLPKEHTQLVNSIIDQSLLHNAVRIGKQSAHGLLHHFMQRLQLLLIIKRVLFISFVRAFIPVPNILDLVQVSKSLD